MELLRLPMAEGQGRDYANALSRHCFGAVEVFYKLSLVARMAPGTAGATYRLPRCARLCAVVVAKG